MFSACPDKNRPDQILWLSRNLWKPLGKHGFLAAARKMIGLANPRYPGISWKSLGKTRFSACPDGLDRSDLMVIQKPLKTIRKSMFSGGCQKTIIGLANPRFPGTLWKPLGKAWFWAGRSCPSRKKPLCFLLPSSPPTWSLGMLYEYIQMYVCIHVCIHTCMHTCMYTCSLCICTCIYTCIYTCM